VAIHGRLKPRGKIHRAIWRRYAHVAEVAGAVAGRNVHAPAEGDGKMGESRQTPVLSVNAARLDLFSELSAGCFVIGASFASG